MQDFIDHVHGMLECRCDEADPDEFCEPSIRPIHEAGWLTDAKGLEVTLRDGRKFLLTFLRV